MFKKILSSSVLAVSVLTVMTANAAPNTATDNTVTNQADTPSISSISNTTPSGFYVTGQLGYAATHMQDKIVVTPSFSDTKQLPNGGLAGRLAIGYQLNPNLAVELGYLQLSKLKTDRPGHNGYADMSETLRQNAIDLTAKAMLPINDKFSAYGKLGVAYLTSIDTATDINSTWNTNGTNGDNIAKHKLAPEVAIGASYNVTPNVFVDASLTHIQPLGKNRPGNIDFAAVGLGYSFG